MTIELSKNNW